MQMLHPTTYLYGDRTVRRYVIERELPGVGNLSEEQLHHVREACNSALSDTGPGIQWVQSFVTADRIYCHYLAENEQKLREHAKRGGFPCTRVSEVKSLMDPLTATVQNA